MCLLAKLLNRWDAPCHLHRLPLFFIAYNQLSAFVCSPWGSGHGQPWQDVVVHQRQLQTARPLERPQVQLVPEEKELWRQSALSQQKDNVRAQHQLWLADVEEWQNLHLTLYRLGGGDGKKENVRDRERGRKSDRFKQMFPNGPRRLAEDHLGQEVGVCQWADHRIHVAGFIPQNHVEARGGSSKTWVLRTSFIVKNQIDR